MKSASSRGGCIRGCLLLHKETSSSQSLRAAVILRIRAFSYASMLLGQLRVGTFCLVRGTFSYIRIRSVPGHIVRPKYIRMYKVIINFGSKIVHLQKKIVIRTFPQDRVGANSFA